MKDIGFVFSGIGTQWPGMGADLLVSEESFRRGVELFDAAFAPLAGWSTRSLLLDDRADLAAAEVAHPCIMAVEFGLWTLLKSRSVEPELVLGHSGGEVAAAWAAGVLSDQDAALLTYQHSRLLRARCRGRMLHLALPAKTVEELLRGDADRLAVAAYNSPHSFVISGEEEALTALAARPEAVGRARFLSVDTPFHSPELQPRLAEFEAGLAGLNQRPAAVPLISSLLGREVEGPELTAAYWRRHISEPVRFDLAFERALQLGCRRVVEVAPHAALLRDMNDLAAAAGVELSAAPLMVRGEKGLSGQDEAWRLLGVGRPRPEAGPNQLAQSLAGLDFQSRRDRLKKLILDEALALVESGFTPEPSYQRDPAAVPFLNLGLTSLTLMRLKAALTALTGVELSSSALFNHSSPEALADHLAAQPLLGGAAADGHRSRARAAAADHEPLAVVGVGLRLPGGVQTMEQYWELLREGRDAVSLIPADRWDRDRYYHPDREAPGKMYTREAAFIDAPFTGFDAGFFNIAGREARQLDPQQRLLLEMSWEAFEQGAINPAAWQGRRVGVFLGLTNNEYSHAHRDSYHRDLIDAYSLTGATLSGACGRLSYYYGFEGPCFSVDTACSSGLVALNLACQSLRRGESDLALVGAVTLMLTPDLHICFTKLGAVSPDGRSKTFDDQADGYGRGEGGAVLLLRRLSDAERDGDLILGLIRGGALNQDGKSNGLTAPNGLAQRRLIEEALCDAGLSPHEVDYVEAHGTGTALGDSIELDSLAAAYCTGRDRGRPLRLGSVKANIGHLEPAAALASVAKVLACFKHGAIPANIHIKTPNTRFPWADWALEAPTALTPWPTADRPRRAGVSAFGFSGVNGHAILEEYRPEPPRAEQETPDRPLFLTLSARDPGALRELARTVADRLRRGGRREAAALCRSLALNRPHFNQRLFALADDPAALADRLEQSARAADAQAGPAKPGPLGLMFTGQGSQYPGMGRELIEAYPVFAREIERAAVVLAPLGVDLERLLSPEISQDDLNRSAFSQPAICAVSLALWRLWESFGLRFDSVLGHSIGEYPAAAAAGLMTQDQALALVAERGRLMEETPAGGMLAVFASRAEVEEVLVTHPEAVVAGHNAPRSLTVSGPELVLGELEDDLRRKNIGFKRLQVSRAFHSPAMSEAAARFRVFLEKTIQATGERRAEPSDLLFISTVTGGPVPGEIPGPDYWAEQITQPVLFADATAAMAARVGLALEAGPSSALSGLVGQGDTGLTALPSLSPKERALTALLRTLGQLYVRGYSFDWEAVLAPLGGGRASLPAYPFQRETYWMPVINEIQGSTRGADDDPLGRRRHSPLFGPAAVFEAVYSDQGPGFVQQHVIFDQPVSPAAGHLAMVLAAVKKLKGAAACDLLEAEFLSPLVVAAGRARLVQVVIEAPEAPESAFQLVSRAFAEDKAGSGEWLRHCQGRIRFAATPPQVDLDPNLRPEGRSMSPADFYRIFSGRGYNLAEGFRRIRSIHIGADECLAEVRSDWGDPAPAGQVIYPGALDSILQTIMPRIIDDSVKLMNKSTSLFIPLHLNRLTLWRPVPETVYCRATGQFSPETGAIIGQVTAYDAQGRPVLAMDGLYFRLTDYATLYRQLRSADDEFYEETWLEYQPSGGSGTEAPLTVIRLDEPGGRPSELSGDLALVYLGTGSEPDPAEADISAVAEAVKLIQGWLKSGRAGRLYLVTRGTRPTPGDQRIILAGTGLWGLGQSFAQEHPDHWGGLLDLPADFDDRDLVSVTGYLRDPDRPYQDVIRSGRRLALVLDALKPAAREAAPDYSGTQIISGGSGSLGLTLAAHLADRGAQAMILVSRHGPDERGQARIEALRANGLTVIDLRADITDRAALAQALDDLRPTVPPITGVFHAAGLLADGVLAELDDEKIRRVMSVKSAGALALHLATQGDSLRHFVLYSSAAALIGSPGQANYAAANHFLNALAASRRLDGRSGTALAWGPWADGGMATADSRREEHLARQGLLSLNTEEALAALDRTVDNDRPVVGVMRVDWRAFLAARGADREGIFRRLAPPPSPSAAADGPGSTADRPLAEAFQALRSADVSDPKMLISPLKEVVADLLGFSDPERLDAETPMAEFGLDSLMVVQLRNRVKKVLDKPVPVSLAFEYPTLAAVAGWIAASATEGQGEADQSEPAAAMNPDDVLADIERLLNE